MGRARPEGKRGEAAMHSTLIKLPTEVRAGKETDSIPALLSICMDGQHGTRRKRSGRRGLGSPKWV